MAVNHPPPHRHRQPILRVSPVPEAPLAAAGDLAWTESSEEFIEVIQSIEADRYRPACEKNDYSGHGCTCNVCYYDSDWGFFRVARVGSRVYFRVSK